MFRTARRKSGGWTLSQGVLLALHSVLTISHLYLVPRPLVRLGVENGNSEGAHIATGPALVDGLYHSPVHLVTHQYFQSPSTPSMSTEIPAGYHPNYSTEDGDVILLSSDGVKFCVHSLMLRKASSVFEGMISMPAPSHPVNQPAHNVIPLSEPAFVVAFLMDAIYPHDTFPSIANYEEARKIVVAAEKYMFDRVLIILRSVVIANEELRNQTLRLYSLARRCQWVEEIASSSKKTLDKELYVSEHFEQILELSLSDLLALDQLHKSRRVEILELDTDVISIFAMDVNIYGEDDEGGPKAASFWICPGPCNGFVGDAEKVFAALESFKLALKDYVVQNPAAPALFDRNVFGDKLASLTQNFKGIRCESCQRPFVDEDCAWKHFQTVERRIPKTVLEIVQPAVR